jgi:enamine deaminase RidA (YjgF/YER057c/UK114 family)
MSVYALSLMLLAADPVAYEPVPERGLSLGVRVAGGPLVHTGQIVPASVPFAPLPPGDQVLQVFGALRDTLQQAGSKLADVVKLNVVVSHPSVTPLVERELKSRYGMGRLPAVSFVQSPLPHPAMMVAVDAVAVGKPSDDATVMLAPAGATKSPANWAVLPGGGVAYISGQAEAGDGTLADATKSTMRSLWKTVEFLERSPADIVQIKAFLTPMAASADALREIQGAFGEGRCPPVVLVAWQSSLPIEIELIVATPLDPAAMSPVEYLTPPWMTASPVFCRVTRVQRAERLYLSGLFGTQPEPNTPAEVRELFETLRRVTMAAGSDLRHLAKATYYVSDEGVSGRLNELRPEYYDPERPPAASKAMVLGTGRADRTITLDMIAVPR